MPSALHISIKPTAREHQFHPLMYLNGPRKRTSLNDNGNTFLRCGG